MAPRKSDARRSDASVVVAAVPAPVSASPAAPAPAAPAGDEPDAAPPVTPGNAPAQQQQQPAVSSEKRDKEKDAVSIEDLTLPKSIITRLAKGVLPPNTQIQANAILAISKGATVFISYLASHANEHTMSASKKTISPADVFKALDDTELAFLRAPLEAEFAMYNAVQTEKRSSYRQKVRAAKDGPLSKGDDTDMADTAPASPSEPAAKRARVADDAETDDDDGQDPDAESEDNEDEAAAAAAAAASDDEDDDVDDDDDEEAAAQGGSGDETQDALESRAGEGGDEEPDEALDGDESD